MSDQSDQQAEVLTCSTQVNRGDDWNQRRQPCGKKAKGTLKDGSPACGTHLAVEQRETDRIAARLTFEARKAAVSKALRIQVWGWEVGQAVSVQLADLEKMAKSHE